MFLQKLFLINFKNYAQAEIEFCHKFNCFVGNNGEGKTNLLDAIHYLSFCKSFFNSVDSQNILHDAPFFVIQGIYQTVDKELDIYCGIKRNEKKQFKKNKKEYARLADHIGLIPLVMISPKDGELITEGSETRRKFIDAVISQLDKDYLIKLINYNKVLNQRNALLKYFSETRTFQKESIEIWDMQLVQYGNYIFEKRRSFLEEFVPLFQQYYDLISSKKEKVSIVYETQLHDNDFHALLNQSVQKDLRSQFSSVGIHKDDLSFNLSEFSIRKNGSQGQQKSFLIALKLAQFDYLKRSKDFNPVLLLDDVFDKLDQNRVEKLMDIVSSDNFGQIFITDTHKNRVESILLHLNSEFKIFEIENGMVL